MQSNELMKELIDKINSYQIENESFEALFAFGEPVSPLPVDKVYIAFSSGGAKVMFLQNEDEEACKRTQLTIKINFYANNQKSAKQLYDLSDNILDKLMLDYAGMMTDFHTESLTTDDTMRLLKLPVSMSFTFEQCPAFAAGGDVIKPFAEFFCKSHVKNDEIHLTAQQKQFVAAPYAVGSYTGNGEEKRKITLNFRPSVVFVFRNQSVVYAKNEERPESYFAMAAGSRAMKGLAIAADGFEISFSEETHASGVYPNLNNLGSTYAYVALR